ncbi:MAG TPA: hypothetical protein VK733_09030 [Gemmatimonadaceae bacterium]|nr:hypothetical protein [Gemmatimonadaceae bacterium]
MSRNARVIVFSFGLVFSASVASEASAQAWNYPEFQAPRVVNREFNFAVFSSGDGGTGLLAQWREGIAPDFILELEFGFTSPPHHLDTHGLIGGSLGYQLARESKDIPLDFLLTGGFYDAFGSPNEFRIPFGISIGHRFPIQGSTMAITPYIEPRLSIDNAPGDTKLGVEFDIGGSMELTPQISVRLLGTFGGSNVLPNDPGIGFSVAWTPLGLTGARK